jgi:hypothetical protein
LGLVLRPTITLRDKHIITPNEPNGVVIRYHLKNKASGPVKVTVTDPPKNFPPSTAGGCRPHRLFGICGLWRRDGRARRLPGGAAVKRHPEPMGPTAEYVIVLEVEGRD